MITCAFITDGADNLTVCHKELTNYIEGDAVCIEFKTGPPDMVYKEEFSAIIVKGVVTNGVANGL